MKINGPSVCEEKSVWKKLEEIARFDETGKYPLAVRGIEMADFVGNLGLKEDFQF